MKTFRKNENKDNTNYFDKIKGEIIKGKFIEENKKGLFIVRRYVSNEILTFKNILGLKEERIEVRKFKDCFLLENGNVFGIPYSNMEADYKYYSSDGEEIKVKSDFFSNKNKKLKVSGNIIYYYNTNNNTIELFDGEKNETLKPIILDKYIKGEDKYSFFGGFKIEVIAPHILLTEIRKSRGEDKNELAKSSNAAVLDELYELIDINGEVIVLPEEYYDFELKLIGPNVLYAEIDNTPCEIREDGEKFNGTMYNFITGAKYDGIITNISHNKTNPIYSYYVPTFNEGFCSVIELGNDDLTILDGKLSKVGDVKFNMSEYFPKKMFMSEESEKDLPFFSNGFLIVDNSLYNKDLNKIINKKNRKIPNDQEIFSNGEISSVIVIAKNNSKYIEINCKYIEERIIFFDNEGNILGEIPNKDEIILGINDNSIITGNNIFPHHQSLKIIKIENLFDDITNIKGDFFEVNGELYKISTKVDDNGNYDYYYIINNGTKLEMDNKGDIVFNDKKFKRKLLGF